MPTGYTSDLYEGKPQTVDEFLIDLAGSRGAFIHLRDSAEKPSPKKLEPSTYHRDALKKAKERLAEVQAWSLEQAQAEADQKHQEAVAAHEKSKRSRRAMRDRYEDMLEKVHLWRPPTEEHESLKEYAIEQLESSIEHDCKLWSGPPVEPTPAQQYKSQAIADARRDIEYHAKQWSGEQERVTSRNRWIEDFFNSLPNDDEAIS